MSITSAHVSSSAVAPRRVLAHIDGWPLTVASRADALARCGRELAAGNGFIIACMNLDHVAKLRSDEGLRRAYRNPRTHVMADGAPVAALARWQGAAIERSPGPDLVLPLCREAARRGWPIYMFGTRQGVLEAGAARLEAECPGLRICGIEAPPFGYDPRSADADAAVDRMVAAGARLVLVGLGSPKQEIFADRALARHPGLGLVCIGAALDFIAGEQQRAPGVMRNYGLEWLWRLATSPRRLGVRYLRCALVLADIVLRRRPPGGGA